MTADAVVVLVVAARLLVPLAIPGLPLPSILLALVLDAADQTIFQAVGAGEDVAGYQSYDKALDVYYLTIAYAATLRNWIDPVALGVARLLFYWRLVGVVAFELTGARVLLILFPNTFEYFFIFYEAVRLFWNPSRLRRAQVIGAAAAIWVFVKLPQEYWIHIAQLDVTDVVTENPWVLGVLALAVVALALVARRFVHRLPSRERPRLRFHPDAYVVRLQGAAVVPRTDVRAIFSMAVLEKMLLISMVAVIFSQVLPNVNATEVQLAGSIAVIVAANSVVSLWRVRRGTRWASTFLQFISMMATNTAILAAMSALDREGGDPFRPANTLFFLFLISLIVTMYDRYRVIGNESRMQPACIGV